MALGALRDQILGAVSFFGDDEFRYYPEALEGDTVTKVIPENWRKKFPYQFRVIRNNGDANKTLNLLGKVAIESFLTDPLGASATINNTTGSPAGWDAFNLQINPESLTQDENFAINVSATQSGTVAEHNGIIFRDLVISGTTGVHPRRGATGANNKGKVIFASRKLRSGYEEFHLLRNYFRAYAEAKRAGDASLQLLFVNQKDNETLIIEPMKFTMKKSASRATLYDYNIVLKVIGNHDPNFVDVAGFLDTFDDAIESIQDTLAQARGILLGVSDILRNVEKSIDTAVFGPLRQLDLALTELVGLPNQLSHMGDNLVNKFSNSATLGLLFNTKQTLDNLKRGLPPSTEPTPTAARKGLGTDNVTFPTNLQAESTKGGRALLALGALAGTQIQITDDDLDPEVAEDFALEKQEALQITVSDIQELQANAADIALTAAGAFNIGSPEFDEFLGRETPNVESVKVTTNDEIEALYGFALLDEALTQLLSIGEPLVPRDEALELARINDFFENSLTLQNPNSVITVNLNPGVSLESLAIQFLGDATRWMDIANLNNLKPPYIDADSSSPFVKKPGDKILIPSGDAPAGTVRTVFNSRFTDNLSETERQMGVDIRLNDEFDFVIGSNNDFQFATAGTNLKQALRIKLSLEKGDLIYHQGIGVGLIVGQKNINPLDISQNIESIVLNDPRVQSINNLRVEVVGNAINIKMRIQPRGSNSPVPIELNL